jgi:uncharacterized tellurite resistance protein B-like protein
MHPRIEKLKAKYEETRDGLDHLQEEVLKRGIEMRPGLRRQFDEALRGLFYTMACADGRIDEREVAFYNYLFEEELSVTTFELVMAQLERSSPVFEEDFLATVGSFASYDASITGKIPLGAPSLAALLISAADAVGRLVMESDGDIDQAEIDAMKKLLVDAKARAVMVKEGAEDLLTDGARGAGYDPDALLARDVRGLQRLIVSGFTEVVLQAADVVRHSGLGMTDPDALSRIDAAKFVIDGCRDDLERGRATGEILAMAAAQMRPVFTGLKAVEQAGDAVKPAWRTLAGESRQQAGALVAALKAHADSRVRVLLEKHDWHDDVSALQSQIEDAWGAL